VAADPAGERDIVVGTRLAVVAPLADVGRDRRRRGARGRVQERPDPAAPGAGRRASASGSCRAASCSARRRPRSDSIGRRGRAIRPVDLPPRPIGARRRSRSSTSGEELGRRRLACSRARWAAPRPASTGAASRRSSSSTGAGTASVVLCRDCGHVQACPIASGRSCTTRRARRCAATTAAGDPARVALPDCGSPRIRYLGGGTERVGARGPRDVPGLRVGGWTATSSSTEAPRSASIDAFAMADRRPRRDEPRRRRASTSRRHAGRDRLVGRRAQPARRACRRATVPAPRPGDRPGGPRRSPGPARSSRPTSRTTRRSGAAASGDRTAFYDAELALRERFGSPPFGASSS
jgi:hypothetical protein